MFTLKLNRGDYTRPSKQNR